MDGVESLKQRVDELAGLATVDPALLSGDQALAWARALAHVRHLSDSLVAPIAARLDELSSGLSRFARWKGYSSAPAMLAAVTGLQQADAAHLIELGRTMTREIEVVVEVSASARGDESGPVPGMPETDDVVAQEKIADGGGEGLDVLTELSADNLAGNGGTVRPTSIASPHSTRGRVLSPLARAARDGALGEPKIRVIAKTLDDMTVDAPELEAYLVERAARLSLRELRVLCLREFARLDPEGYGRRQAVQRTERELKFYPRTDGMIGVTGQLDVETAGHVLAWFDAETKAAKHAQRKWDESEQRTVPQINADILAALARHAAGCDRATTRPKTTMVVRVKEESIRERVGVGSCDSLEAPISVERLRRMAIDAEVLPIVMGGESLPLDVGRASRYFTPAQRVALGQRDDGCAKCHAPLTWCDAHHIDWWKFGGASDLLNGVMLCVGCHHRIHDCGWAIEVVNGAIEFIPPATADPHRRRQRTSSARLAA